MNRLWAFDSRRSSINSSRSSSLTSSQNNANSDPSQVYDMNMAELAFAQPSELLVPRPLPMPLAGITKLRDRLSFKHARAALAEREILKRENRCKRPLTARNVDTFLIEQDLNDARIRRADNLHVSQWLQQLP
jgi:hypothetical protein